MICIHSTTFYQPLGDSKTSFVDTRDIAAVAVAALTKSREHKNKAYDITGPVTISNYEIAEIISDVAGKKITYVDVSDSVARERLVRNAGINTLIFTGIATDLGIESNARESLNRDFYTVIASDAVSSFDREWHMRSLENPRRIINVISSKDLVNI